MLKTAPAVFAVGKTYQIMVPVTDPSLFRIKVGDKYYYDESNGIMRSMTDIHRVTVPQAALDEAKSYTVCERKIIDRKPYFPETEPETETNFAFSPLPQDNFRAFHIADAHNAVETPVAAAKAFGDIDLLILNGDIPNHSGETEYFNTIYEIAGRVTGGNIPIVYARGNHDLRGLYAEKISEYTPNENGNTYYSFRIGSVWGVILDCGEDKDDLHAEYGFTVSCHPFRERQVDFLQKLVDDGEYNDASVKYKLVVCHVPFTRICKPPFDIEQDIYAKWAKLLRENIKPDIMLCGHKHSTSIYEVGGEKDDLGQPCTVIVGAKPEAEIFIGTGLEFSSGTITATFVASDGSFSEKHVL